MNTYCKLLQANDKNFKTFHGKVHTVDKDQGVQLVLKDNQKIYPGSKRIPALEHALARLREEASKEISLFVNPS